MLAGAPAAPPPSPARTRPPERSPLRLGLVQERWHPEPAEHQDALATGIRMAAGEGARLVCLQELTLSPYFAITADGRLAAGAAPEDLESGYYEDHYFRPGPAEGDPFPLIYGSSFISDPYGRVLVQAPRDRPAALVADLDLDQRRDWLQLFPFLTTRRPDVYGVLAQTPVRPAG